MPSVLSPVPNAGAPRAFVPVGLYGSAGTITPSGELRIVAPPTQKFTETWDLGSIDSINKWIATSGGGGVAPTAAAGQGQLSSGVTLNGFAKLTTIQSFRPTAPGQLYCDDRIGLEAAPILATGHRFWGQGTSNASPTIASPILNAMGWEITTAGQLVPVVYASGARVAAALGAAKGLPTLTAAFAQITDGISHNYFRYFEGRRGFWCVDDPDNIVAFFLFGNGGPDVNSLPLLYQCISNGGTAVTLNINGIDVGDTADTSGAVLLNNGFTYDEMVPNKDTNATLITAVAATTSQTGTDQLNVNGRGVKVVLDMTNVGTGSVTITIQGKDIVSGKYYTLLAGAAVTTISTNVYEVYPGLPATANVSANATLPRTWRVITTANNANATTYTVGASVIL